MTPYIYQRLRAAGILLALGLLTACGSNDRTPLENPTIDPPQKNISLIGRVLDYRPAPGQHINKLPAWDKNATQDTMNRRATEALRSGMGISLGGFGGYVTIALSERVPNTEGRDLRIMGNSIEWQAVYNPNPNPPGLATSSEPGIVQVAYDANGNGKPDDDEWYELAGSIHSDARVIRPYNITYFRPEKDKAPMPGGEELSYLSDLNYIRWTDSRGQSGYIPKNMYHEQSYFPEWIEGDSYTLSGTLLPSHVVQELSPDKKQSLWVAYALGWGYVDDMIASGDGSTFDISWAIDQAGKSVSLPAIDFIRIYTAMHDQAGPMGEISTDFVGIERIQH